MKADWELIYKAYCGIQWIMETDKTEVAEKKVKDVYQEKIMPIWGTERLLNDGVLMMASYILLVYIHEKERRKKVNLNSIDISKFKITFSKQKPKPTPKELLRRLRNALSHGKYRFMDDGRILFHDYDPRNRKKTEIRFQIDKVEFGMFLTNFAKEIDRQVNTKKSA